VRLFDGAELQDGLARDGSVWHRERRTGLLTSRVVDVADPLAFRMAVNEAVEALAPGGSVPALPLA
jgi:hypothetical protein